MHIPSGSYAGALLGGILGNIIFGATTAQTLLYFSRFSNDSRRTRTLVTVVWILEALSMLTLLTLEVTQLVVASYDPQKADTPWLKSLWLALGCVLTGLVQGFYMWRLYRLSRNPYALFVMALLFIVKSVISVVMCIWLGRGREELFLKNVWVIALYLAADASLDLGIAGGTTAFLYRNRTGFKSTDAAMKRIAKYSISAGLVTSIASLITFVMFVTVGTTIAVVTIQIMGVRLHSMALLGSLHMRSSFTERGRGTIDSIHVALSVIRRVDGPVLRRRSMSTPPPESILDMMRTADDREMLPVSSDVKLS
ncbi:hypothetical protein BS47DRAFT_1489450 [Hydnum rufescens UP504]|uniref:DUF6534 domain-containing protein n=1 Tax=Hydnum rufescens UP504 TaxID=1448309 RepID=A0A9P6DPH4_9AGAM|nr:hypothetical protein BS47DRAFT_1489450 [Hydnum rufescens UP504]